MYDENNWNEMNNENEKKDGGEPVNAQNAQNAQQPQNRPQDAQQSQGQSEHTGRQIYGRLGGAQSGQPYNGNSTQTRISSMITTRDMDRIRIRTETATMLRRRTNI